MEIQIAIAKIDKYNAPESGDTVEIIERPNGGVSIIIASCISNEIGPKSISMSVSKKVLSLIADGVRDGAAIRAASDSLFTEHSGRATAYLIVLSVDMQTETLVIACNSATPIFIARNETIEKLDTESNPIGTGLNVKPSVTEVPLAGGITITALTQGVIKAGNESGQNYDIITSLSAMLEYQEPNSKEIADVLLSQAIRLDQDRPNHDMSVVVLHTLPEAKDNIRRMSVNLPLSKI